MRTSSPSPVLPFMLLMAALSLTGCGFTADKPTLVSTPSATIKGRIIGGQYPVVGSTVSVWQMGARGYGAGAVQLGPSVTTGPDGSFSFPANSYTCGEVKTPDDGFVPSFVYLLASGGNPGGGNNSSIMLAAGLGSCESAQSASVEINEVTTVATAYALAQFFTVDWIADEFGAPGDKNNTEYIYLMNADGYTIPTLVDLASGTVNPSTPLAKGSTAITIEALKMYSLANTLAACVNTADTVVDSVARPSGSCNELFADTTEGGITPTDTLKAAVSMALYPYANVDALFKLGHKTPPFPGLTKYPTDLTIAVSYATNTMGLGINPAKDGSPTSSNIDIDASGKVWFPSDAVGIGLGYFDPTTNAFSGPFNHDGGIKLPQYMAVNGFAPADTGQRKLAWVTDLKTSRVIAVSTSGEEVEANYELPGVGTGGPVVIGESGYPLFVYTDYTDATTIQFGNFSDASFTISPLRWSATGLALNTTETNDPNDAQYPILVAATSANTPGCYEELSYNAENTIDKTNSVDRPVARVTGPCATGGVAAGPVYLDDVVAPLQETLQDDIAVASTANQLCSLQLKSCFTPAVGLNLPEGIAVDGFGQLWIANSGDGSISTLNGVHDGSANWYTETSPVPYRHNTFLDGTMTSPYGLAIDGAGNVWVSNANPACAAAATSGTCTYLLSELIGAAAPTITPLMLQDDRLQGTVPNPLRTPAFLQVGPKSAEAPKRAAPATAMPEMQGSKK